MRGHTDVAIVKSLSHKKSSWDTLGNINWGYTILMQPLWQTFLQKQNSNFKLYLRKHTRERPCKCSYCEKGLLTKYHLEINSTIHTREKSYISSHCDQAFLQNCILKLHSRKHTGDSSHKCSYCEKALSQKYNLR